MNPSYRDIFNLLVTYPGNLTYHLVLTFAVAGALQASLGFRQKPSSVLSKRMTLGLLILLISRILLFLAAAFTIQNTQSAANIIPVLDRFVTAVSVLIIVWLWIFPTTSKLGDTGVIIASLITVILFILSVIWWKGQTGDTFFNTTWMSKSWNALSIILLGFGLVMLIIRKPENWGSGFGIIAILLIGHSLQLIFSIPTNNHFPGILRLTEIAVYPLLLTLPNRLLKTAHHNLLGQQTKPVAKEQIELDTAPTLLTQIANLINAEEPEIPKIVARVIGDIFLADYTLIATKALENEKVDIICAYDLIREEILNPFVLEGDKAPKILTAIRNKSTLILKAKNFEKDTKSLRNALGISKNGNLLSAPLFDTNENLIFSVILFSPFSDNPWDENTKNALINILLSISIIIGYNQTNKKLNTSYTQLQQNYKVLEEKWEKSEETKKEIEAKLKELAKYVLKQKMQIIPQTLQSTQKQALSRSTFKNARKESTSYLEEQQEDQLTEVINEIETEFRLQAVEKNVSLILNSPPNLPVTIANKNILKNALSYLVNNAILVTEPGGAVTISVSTKKTSADEDYLHIQITDQGDGISSSDIPLIFSESSGSTDKQIQGIGESKANLRRAKKAIELLNGHIWIESTTGVGSAFHVIFPATPEAENLDETL